MYGRKHIFRNLMLWDLLGKKCLNFMLRDFIFTVSNIYILRHIIFLGLMNWKTHILETCPNGPFWNWYFDMSSSCRVVELEGINFLSSLAIRWMQCATDYKPQFNPDDYAKCISWTDPNSKWASVIFFFE